MILGHGIDIVEHAAFSRLIEQEEAFLNRCFIDAEIKAGKAAPNPVQWFASRFAVKEAVMKAIGTGWSQGVAWQDIAIMTSAEGTPTVVLAGKTAERARLMGIADWRLSLSHSQNISIASAIALGKSERR